MSSTIRLSPSWRGFVSIRKLMIFGDSYSDVGYSLAGTARPDDINPMGVDYPGTTWNETGKPNWVGHLIASYAPPPRYNPQFDQQAEDYHANPLLVYDYAVGGDLVAGVKRQITDRFLPRVGKKPDWAPWAAEDSLFVTWVGINDCAYSRKHDSSIKRLFELQAELYDAGARNFCFIDVPPIQRSPAIPAHSEDEYSGVYSGWNECLLKGAQTFSAERQDATVLLFSSWDTFTKLLDSPKEHGFAEEAARKAWGPIWHDHLHPTSAVHNLIARDFAEFLGGVRAL
ncbi:hypothetical protein AX16_003591 [Volvariella volvacea WC 439]|nr:hypothetical protein AX16_003591 [Volvariella volvacea WC 439]